MISKTISLKTELPQSHIIGKDIDWRTIHMELCKVVEIVLCGKEVDGKIKFKSFTMPYAILKILSYKFEDYAYIFVRNKKDLIRICEAYSIRDESKKEEILIGWSSKESNPSSIWKRFFPSLNIFLFTEGAYKYFSNSNWGEKLKEAYHKGIMVIKCWSPLD